MSVADKLQTIQNIKDNIKTSIQNKGVEVGDNFNDYPAAIDSIETNVNLSEEIKAYDGLALDFEYFDNYENVFLNNPDSIKNTTDGSTADCLFVRTQYNKQKAFLFVKNDVPARLVDIADGWVSGNITKLNCYTVGKLYEWAITGNMLKEINLGIAQLASWAVVNCTNLEKVTATLTSDDLSGYDLSSFVNCSPTGTVYLTKLSNITLTDDEIREHWGNILNGWDIIIN